MFHEIARFHSGRVVVHCRVFIMDDVRLLTRIKVQTRWQLEWDGWKLGHPHFSVLTAPPTSNSFLQVSAQFFSTKLVINNCKFIITICNKVNIVFVHIISEIFQFKPWKRLRRALHKRKYGAIMKTVCERSVEENI